MIDPLLAMKAAALHLEESPDSVSEIELRWDQSTEEKQNDFVIILRSPVALGMTPLNVVDSEDDVEDELTTAEFENFDEE